MKLEITKEKPGNWLTRFDLTIISFPKTQFAVYYKNKTKNKLKVQNNVFFSIIMGFLNNITTIAKIYHNNKKLNHLN